MIGLKSLVPCVSRDDKWVVTALCFTINEIAFTISGLPTVLDWWIVDDVPSLIY
jgi:hypothetical protein